MSYKVNDEHALGLGGFVAYIDDQRTGETRAGDTGTENDKEYSDYLHELELSHTYRLNNRQSFVSSLYSEYEKNVYQGTTEIWEARFRFNHALENGKTNLSFFTRLSINRESRGITETGRETTDIDRTGIGVSASHKVNEDRTLLGETWYQTQTKENGPSQDTVFTKLAMRYSY